MSILAASMAIATASAQVKPGDVITPENATKVQNLVSPGVYYMVQHGMQMNIVPTERVDWPPPYMDATEKYSSQVSLTADHRSMIGYVAGQPFPLIDANDPYVAEKVIWNNVFRPIQSDDYDLRYFDCQSEYVRPGKEQQIIDNIEVGHYAGYNLVGRTEVEPLPVDPDFKKTGRFWLFALYPVLAPQDARGTGIIRFRYADPKRGDDSWDWNPGSRRVRRLNESILSTATGAQTFDPDHYSGFNPKTEQYDYKFLGEKELLASVHAAHSPEVTCATDGGASACPENWEARHMYIVEATPRRDVNNPGALDKKTIVYLDSEVWFEPYIDTYDQSGQLWRTHIYWLAYRDRPVPDARIAIYPFKTGIRSRRGLDRHARGFLDDVLSARATYARARVLVHQPGRSRQAIFHGPGDGSSVALGPLEAAGRPNPQDGAKRRESLRPVLEKGDDGFQELEICSGNRVAALSFISAAAALNERGRSETPAPNESLSIGGASIKVEIDPGELSVATHSGPRLDSEIGLRRNRILRRVSRPKRRCEDCADRRRQGSTLWPDSPGRSNSRDKSRLVEVRY